MIYTFFVALAALLLGAGLIYIFDQVIDPLITIQEATFPVHFSGTIWDMLKAFNNWKTLFLILIPTLIWIIVNNQGPRGEGV